MAKRQPFDTNLSFPPAPTRALASTPLDGIIGGPAPRTEPPPPPTPVETASESAATSAPGVPDPAPAASLAPAPVAEKATAAAPAPPTPQGTDDPADSWLAHEEAGASPGPVDDGKVTVKLPPELKNRLYNAIYAERATVGDFLTRAVDDLMDQLERERGGPYPQRPPADVKFRAGRRPR